MTQYVYSYYLKLYKIYLFFTEYKIKILSWVFNECTMYNVGRRRNRSNVYAQTDTAALGNNWAPVVESETQISIVEILFISVQPISTYRLRIVNNLATLPFASLSDWTKFAGMGMRFLLCCPLSVFLIFFFCLVVETHDDSAPQVDWWEQSDLEQCRFPGWQFILSTSSVIYRLNVLNVAWN